MSWTDEKVAKLKELWGKGSTASQIAEILGGVSRNAVIGKAHRLNLSGKIITKKGSLNNKNNKVKNLNQRKIRRGKFKETNRLKPNSPYSSSKASADLLCRAWYKTFGLPIITTNCSNNFGPFQHKEKLIPKIIYNIVKNKNRNKIIRKYKY